MASPLELRKLTEYRRQIAGERLEELCFKNAFRQCLGLMELSFNMVESMASRSELIRIQNEHASLRNLRYARQHKSFSRTKPAKGH